VKLPDWTTPSTMNGLLKFNKSSFGVVSDL
jgi:hypothetical protein